MKKKVLKKKKKKEKHEHADVTRIRISPGKWTCFSLHFRGGAPFGSRNSSIRIRSVKNLGMGTWYPFFLTSFDSDFL